MIFLEFGLGVLHIKVGELNRLEWKCTNILFWIYNKIYLNYFPLKCWQHASITPIELVYIYT